MDLDKSHGCEVYNGKVFNLLYTKELEEWIRSMYLLPEEFEFQKQKILHKVREKVLEESGW